ncbi:MAG TPA: hypothetical protein PKL98_02200 [Candidatus Pacearchaeota archaeon]|nr:hypothetical protein [Candidatus Pacearchaeota archaeon]
MDSYKKRMLYIWFVPLLGAISLISFAVWYAIIGHESTFGFFPTPDKPSFSNDMLYGGLALMYLIPVFLFVSWFGAGVINAIKKLFKKKKKYEDPSNFDLLETGWHKAIVLITFAVGFYALPAIVFLYALVSIFFIVCTGESSSISASDSGISNGYSCSSGLTGLNISNNDLQKAYQYTSGILKGVKDRKLELSIYQKDSLREATTYLSPYSEESEIDRAVDAIEKVASELYISKDPYYKDRGEIYISPYQGSDERNRAEFVYGIKKDIKRIIK